MKKKMLLMGLAIFGLMMILSCGAYASTSSSIEAMAEYLNLKQRYGNDFDGAFSPVTTSNIEDNFMGTYTTSETDISLPGKGNLDFELRRMYFQSHADNEPSYYMRVDSDSKLAVDKIGFWYENDAGERIIFCYSNMTNFMNSDTKDVIYCTSDYEKNVNTDAINQRYYYPSGKSITTADDPEGICFTRRKDLEPVELMKATTKVYSQMREHYTRIFPENYNWVFNIPKAAIHYDYYIMGVEPFMDIMVTMTTLDGEVHQVETHAYWPDVSGDYGNRKEERIRVVEQAMKDDFTHERGFDYAFKIYDKKLRVYYYFDYHGVLHMVEDEYGNTQLYTYDEEGRPLKIIDSMRRAINFDYHQKENEPMDPVLTVTVTAGGEVIQKVEYEYLVRENGLNYDPYVDLDKTYFLIAKQYDSDSTFTEYRYQMSIKEQFLDGYATRHTKLLLDNASKTGAATLYLSYEEYDRRVNRVSLEGDTQEVTKNDYRVIEKKYSGNEEWYQYTYDAGPFLGDTSGIITVKRVSDNHRVEHYFDAEGRKSRVAYKSDEYYREDYVYDNTDSQNSGRDYVSQIQKQWSNYTINPTKTSVIRESYVYDDCGNVLQKTEGDYHEENTYHGMTLLTKEYKRDAEHTVKVENTLTEDERAIAKTCVYEKTGDGEYELKEQTDYEYDSFGNVSKRIVHAGEGQTNQETSYTYDYNADGSYTMTVKMPVQKTAEGSTSQKVIQVYTYDKAGNLSQFMDSYGNTTYYTNDMMGRLLTTSSPGGASRTITYNDYRHQITETDEMGTSYRYDYNSMGQQIGVYYREAGTYGWKPLEKRTYDTEGRVKTIQTVLSATNSSGAQTYYISEYTYDELSRVTSETVKDQNGTVITGTTSTYDWLVTLSTGAMYPYDTTGWQFQSQKVELLSSLEGSKPVYYIYRDIQGRTLKEVLASGATGTGTEYVPTTYKYDYLDQVTHVMEPRANVEGWTEAYSSAFTYDYAGNTIAETNVLGDSTGVTYNMAGQVVAETDAMGATTTYTYDGLGRLIEAVSPVEGNTTVKKQTQYDLNGNVIKEKVQNNAPGEAESFAVKEYKYNADNVLIGVIEYVSSNEKSVTQYVVDTKGRVLKVIKGLTEYDADIADKDLSAYQVTEYTYNGLGQMLSAKDPSGETETFTYDLQGNMRSMTDRNGQTTNYTYDYFRNLLTSGNLTYQYDALGNLIYMSDESGETVYVYDNLGRLTSETKTYTAHTSEKTYQYDTGGNRTSMVLTIDGTEQQHMRYAYDKLNRLSNVYMTENGTETEIASYTYDANGRMTANTNPETGITTTYAYDLANQLTEQVTKKGTSVLEKSVYTRYLDGNVKTETDGNNQVISYAYDGLGQLTQETEGTKVTAYTYDTFRNRSVRTITRPTQTTTINYTYDKNNRLIKQELSRDNVLSSARLYGYDKNGNLLYESREKYESEDDVWDTGEVGLSNLATEAECDLWVYSYNERNQLIEVLAGEGDRTQYTYDGMGLRTKKVKGNTTTNSIWDGDQIIAETNASFVIQRQFYYGQDRIGAKFSDGMRYYVYNGHGDVTKLVNEAGTVKTSYDYDAFGVQQITSSLDENPFRYCGEYYDNESGNIYLRGRYYSPSTGRFLTEDPAEDGANWYVYCNNDPVNRIDPEGTSSFREKWEALCKVGPFDATSIYNIGNSTLIAAQNYALEKGLTSVTDNIADAYRHFSWNYDAVKKGISVEDVMQATTNHEVLTQQYMGKDSNGIKYYKVALSSLMDLQNNKAGRYQATLDANRNKTSREVFDRLASYGGVVTSLEHVKQIWGIKDDWLYSAKDGVRGEVSVLIKNGLEENALNIVVVNKNEIEFK